MVAIASSLQHAALKLWLLASRKHNEYSPYSVACPGVPLIRPANGLSDNEESYRVARKASADVALRAWLTTTNPAFGTGDLPTVALTSSGGGFRAQYLGGGVIQGLDARDSTGNTNGLFQALTYQAALSGGAWMLASLAGNNYPTITYLKNTLWKTPISGNLLTTIEDKLGLNRIGAIPGSVLAKDDAGYSTTIVDVWGRYLSYGLLEGNAGGVQTTLSSIRLLSNFTANNAPYPIITALGAKTFAGECEPGPNGTTYELTPYEFGSWDRDLSAFTPTAFLGTSLSNGIPTSSQCTNNYDNLGYALGTSSNVFAVACSNSPTFGGTADSIKSALQAILRVVHKETTEDLYALYKNPFYKYRSETSVLNPANDLAAQDTLTLTDGGMALQNNPIFPFLQPTRNISVILVNDNSADTNNYPNGSAILTTYVQSFEKGLTRMPFIPSVDTFLAQGLNQHAVFFGCNAPDKVTIVYLPNAQYTYASNKPTSQLSYSSDEIDKMVANGEQIATQGDDKGWGVCLGCAIMMKGGQALPAECGACFQKYCYYPTT